MRDFHGVFNLTNAPFGFFDEKEMHLIPGRRWRMIPKAAAMKLIDTPKLFVDFGAGSFSDSTLPYRQLHSKAINFAAILDTITGYGNASHPILEDMLHRPDLEVKISRTGFWDRNFLSGEVLKAMDDFEFHEDQPRPYIPGHHWDFDNPVPVEPEAGITPLFSRWSIALTVPSELDAIPSPRKLLYTMAEGDTIPAGSGIGRPWQDDRNDWVSFINNYADVLVVPCQEMKRVFEKSGIGQEAHVVPLGTSFDVYTYTPRTDERLPLFAIAGTPKREKRDVFTIVVDGHLAPRKAPSLALLEVVYPVMEKYHDWRMVIKCRAGESGMIGGIKDDRLVVVAADFSPEQMSLLYHGADVGLCLSLYEGWGMTFREMMASGLPVIVSETSGHKEDCNPDYNYPVPIKEKEEIHDFFNLSAYRDIPDWEVARKHLEKEYQDWRQRGHVQSAMGERAAKWVRERRAWKHTVDALLGLVDQYDNLFTQQRRYP